MAKWVNPETLPASEIPDVRDLRDRCVQILNTLIPLSATESAYLPEQTHTRMHSDRCCLKRGGAIHEMWFLHDNEWMKINEKITSDTRMMRSVTCVTCDVMHVIYTNAHSSFIPAEQFPGVGDAPLLDLQLNQLTRSYCNQLTLFLSNNRTPHWHNPSFSHWICWWEFAGNLLRKLFSPLD